jgi:hypothetical protein
MSKTFKDMRELSAAKAKKLAKTRKAKRDVLNMLSKAYDTSSQVFEFFEENEYSLTRDDVKALV